MPALASAPKGAVELQEARTLKTKTYDLGNGQRRVVASLRPAHVPHSVRAWEAGEPVTWLDPDTSIELKDGFYQVKNAWYRLYISPSGNFSYRVESRRENDGDVLVELDSLNGAQPKLNLQPVVSGETITFPDVVPDLDLILICRPAKVEFIKRLKSVSAPKIMAWKVGSTSTSLVRGGLSGMDNADGANQSRQAETDAKDQKRGMVLTETQNDLGIVNGRPTKICQEVWSGETLVANKTTRVKERSADVVYPVHIDPTITETVAADADDGCENNNATWATSGHYYYGDILQPFYGKWPGWRFTTIALPQGATINSADLTIHCGKLGTASPDFSGTFIYADKVDNAAAWSGTSRPSQMTKTTAKTSITSTFASTGTKTISVTSIVQEIANRAGWASGNAMRFAPQGGSSERRAYTDDYGTTLNAEAQLVIDYTAGGGGGSSDGFHLIPEAIAFRPLTGVH